MARGIHTRKRSRPSGTTGRSFKKRRTARRRTARKSNNFTSQNGHGGGIRYNGRKVKPSMYRKLLWNSTVLKTKYRSNNVITGTIATPASVSTYTVQQRNAFNTGAQFWTGSGGAIAPDGTQSLPTFTGNMIIRGGKIGLRITNAFDANDALRWSVQCNVMLIKTSRAFIAGAIPTTVGLGWDVTLLQDFATNVGKVVYQKNFLLRDADTANIEYRLKVQTVDPGDYAAVRNTYLWVIIAGNVDNPVSTLVTTQVYHNLSFVGDST